MNHVLAAIEEFAGRYAQAFQAAWSVRDRLDPPRRSEDELAFLPAHLELIDSPVSPLARRTAWIIVAIFCVSLLWAIFGKLDIVAVAPGKTVVDSRTKVIQSAETAVVGRILVRDGQSVKRGQLLIELNANGAAADYEKAGDEWIGARLAELRFAALSSSLRTGSAPVLASAPGLPKSRLGAERQLAASQFEAYRAKRQNLEAVVAQRQAEIDTVQSLIGPLAESAKISTIRAQDYAKLVEGKYVGRHDYLLREQERIAAERDLAAQRNRLIESRSALGVAREQLRSLEADMRQQTLDGLRQARDQAQQFALETAKTGQRDGWMQLRAPVAGTVQQLAVHTVGGVVTPAQPLLAIVPTAEALEVEATVLNKDIGFVKPGQKATVKIESFPYTRYGYLEGVVESVSRDAAQDEKMGLVFPARVKLSTARLRIDGTEVNLTPGMNLSVEIKTGKRSVITYLLSPLQEHSSEAFRER